MNTVKLNAITFVTLSICAWMRSENDVIIFTDCGKHVLQLNDVHAADECIEKLEKAVAEEP